MATTVRAASTNSSSTGTAVSITAPTGTVTGDLVVCVVHGNGQTTIADNNGSTPFTKAAISGDDAAGNYKPNPTGGQTGAIFTRRIQSGDPSTYNFTLGATGRWGVVAVCFQNPHPTTIFDATPVGGNNSDGVVALGSAASITTATDNAIDCPILCIDGGTAQTVTSPGGYTVQGQAPATDQPVTFCTKVITPAGATGARNFSWTANNTYFAMSFAIADIGTGGTVAAPSLYVARSNLRLG
jgi:hypothetical protein